MTIETKFDLRDTVYYSQRAAVGVGVVNEIIISPISHDPEKPKSIKYLVMTENRLTEFEEEELYPSQWELVDKMVGGRNIVPTAMEMASHYNDFENYIQRILAGKRGDKVRMCVFIDEYERIQFEELEERQGVEGEDYQFKEFNLSPREAAELDD
jgi:hypothetical protein